MKSPSRTFRLPALLLSALFLVSCAHSPDRRAAQLDDEIRADAAPRVIVSSTPSPVAEKRARISPKPATATVGQSPAVAPEIARVAMLTKPEKGDREEGEPGPSDPGGALRFRRLQMQDEEGKIPLDGWEKARRQVTLMKAAQVKRRLDLKKAGAPPTPGAQAAGIEPNSWTWLGPGNIGGRIRSIIIHPTSPNNMWVGSVSGGIWRTVNGGASWFPVDDFMANLAVSTMVIHPTNPNILYAGTGEGFGNFDAIQGAGIFQSTDGGVTWNQLASTANNNFFFVNRLAISPDGNTLLAATSNVVDATNTIVNSGGIWRSTDGGTTWNRQTNIPAVDLDFRPGDSLHAIASQIGSAQYTTDGGLNWLPVTFNPAINTGAAALGNGRVEVATSNSTQFAGRMYAAVNRNHGDIYMSNDSGVSFTRVNTGNNLFLGGSNQGWYDNVLWLNPQNPDTIVVGGIHLWRGTTTFGPANLVLTQISNGGTNSAHADHHAIVAHPGFNNTTNRIVYFGNDGGLYRANDVTSVSLGSGWTELNNNLGITQFFGAAGNPATGVIVGGAQDNGTLRYSGNTEGWTSPFGNDGGNCAADQTDANFFYGESQNLAVHRSTNGGVSSSNIFTGIADANVGANTNFIAPLVLDPNDPNTLLAGGISLWRSTNVKSVTPTWASIKAAAAGNPISAIAVSPLTSSLVLVGHNNGDIFRAFNGTDTNPTWTKIDTAALPARFVTRLVIDPNHGSNWYYATFGGFAGDNVYRTTDNGATWVDVTGTGTTGLPNVPVRTLVFHPTDPRLLYVGTEIGIFTSEDAGATWEPSQDGPANVSVDELFWMGGDLVAATHGRGLYRASGGIYVDRNYFGFENGSFGLPFNTVTEGKNAATSYRAVWIRPGNYNETMTINNPNGLELRALGGEVTIGVP